MAAANLNDREILQHIKANQTFDLTGNQLQPYETADRNPMVDRRDNPYMNIYIKISPILSCKIFCSFSGEDKQQNQNFLQIVEYNQIPLQQCLSFTNLNFGYPSHNETIFFQVGGGICLRDVTPFFENASIEVANVFDGWGPDSIPRSIYINVSGLVSWKEDTNEEIQPVPGHLNNPRRLKRAFLRGGKRKIRLTVWHETIDLMKALLDGEEKPMQLTSLRWEMYKGEWQLETTSVTTISFV